MNIIPLNAERRIEHIPIRQNYEISLPTDWWFSDFSVNKSQKKSEVVIYQLQKFRNEKLLMKNERGWNLKKGDYRVQEPYNRKDYVYYRELRIKLMKLSVFPFLLIVTISVFFISNLLSKI